MLYGEQLNRITRVSASAVHVKPLSNIVEAYHYPGNRRLPLTAILTKDIEALFL